MLIDVLFYSTLAMNATPTEYVWKYNPVFGIPAGAQQNYGATINWVLPGGTIMANVANDIRRRTLTPTVTAAVTARFEAESDQQPYANPRETNYITAAVLDSGPPKSGLKPIDPSGVQRTQLAGGFLPLLNRTEGSVQLSGGKTEGTTQLSGGFHGQRNISHRPPRWSGAALTGNGVADEAEILPDTYKYFLRTDGPSQVADIPGVYSRREFMEKYVPAVVYRPFNSSNPGDFPAYFSALYKGRNAFEDIYWDW
ncbi:pVIII [Aviadenovirus phalacrocoracidae]|uniref:Pre-hexon-linking protein VIII n=1 Tax=Aviadenovirus sp. TaxID=2217649 RepID=A0ABZ0T2X7_9ADEN|nr:pVIII [Aviadenovirus sp.]